MTILFIFTFFSSTFLAYRCLLLSERLRKMHVAGQAPQRQGDAGEVRDRLLGHKHLRRVPVRQMAVRMEWRP